MRSIDQAGVDEGAGAHPDVDVEVVEIDAVERLVEGAQGADLVDGAPGGAAGQSQAHPRTGGPGSGLGVSGHGRLI